MLMFCLSNYCQNDVINDTIPLRGIYNGGITISFADIRIINSKLLELRYTKQELLAKDTIIQLNETKYNELNKEALLLQDRVKSLNAELIKSNKKKKVYGIAAITGVVATLFSFIIK